VKATAVRDAREAVRDGIRSRALKNAHDISEGGVAVAIAECCVAGGIGAAVELPPTLELFAESPGCAYIVSGDEDAVRRIGTMIGRVGGGELEIAGRLNVAVSELRAALAAGLEEFV
jgi:phosphoribosylformylglycinamidine synthase